MAKQLEDLVAQRFSKMNYKDKLDFIAKVRRSRMTPAATSKVVKDAKKKSEKKVEKMENLLDKLTDEQIQMLLGG